METQAKVTTDHEVIREWAEVRGGYPAVTLDEARSLRIDFGDSEEELGEISWGEFFALFEEKELALLYQEESLGGGESYFYRFIGRFDEERLDEVAAIDEILDFDEEAQEF